VNKDRSADVAAWWERAAKRQLAEDGFAQIDIDEITDDPPLDAARAGLEYLLLAIDFLRRSRTPADGILTIPLGSSGTLDTEPPRLDQLLATAWTYGPGLEVPGLYLVTATTLAMYEPSEEYLIDITGTAVLPKGLSAYYRCWRLTEDAKRGWEYDRTIYVRTNRFGRTPSKEPKHAPNRDPR
jgi:hypothetical protein